MRKKILLTVITIITACLILNFIWSIRREGNLAIYIQNEQAIVKPGEFDIKVFLQEEEYYVDSLAYNQVFPKSKVEWMSPGIYTIEARSETLDLSRSKRIFLFSATWVVVNFFEDKIEIRVSRWPVTLQ